MNEIILEIKKRYGFNSRDAEGFYFIVLNHKEVLIRVYRGPYSYCNYGSFIFCNPLLFMEDDQYNLKDRKFVWDNLEYFIAFKHR